MTRLDGIRRTVDRNRSIVIAYVATLGLLVAVSLIRPGFGLGSEQGIRSLALEASVIGLIALGQTLVILSGGIDLSMPWTLATTAIVMTEIADGDGVMMLVAIPIALALAAAIGATNGVLVAVIGISPVVATLGMNAVLMGAVAGFLQGIHGDAPEALIELVRARTLGLPNVVWMFLLLVVALSLLLSRTTFGRQLYAVGANREVARYSGIGFRSMAIRTYALAAVLNGIAGILIAGKTSYAFLGMGDPYLFISVTAVALGGASLLGGNGHVIGTVAGALLLTVLSASIPVLRLPRSFDLVTFGLVILIAVVPASGKLSLRWRRRPRRGEGPPTTTKERDDDPRVPTAA